MKKVKVSILLLFLLIGISNFCYADVIYSPTVTEVAVEVIRESTELIGHFYIIIPLIIVYGILVKIIISKNKEKSKKIKKKTCLNLFVTMIILSISIACITKVIIDNTVITIKYGYADTKRNTVIQPEFEYAEEFYDGVARIGVNATFNDSRFRHGGGYTKVKLYGYIDKSGEFIVEPLYYTLSYFNEEGYAFGIQTTNVSYYDNAYYDYYDNYNNYDKYDFTYRFEGKIGIFCKIDKNGNVKEITKEEYDREYYKNEETKEYKKDNIIMLKKNVDRKFDIEYILVESIFPVIIALLALITIIKTCKKEVKSDSTNIK